MTRPSSFSSWTSTWWCPSGPERNRLEVSEPHAGRDSQRREAVRLRAREEQIYRCYSFSKGPFARCGFSRLIMTLTVLGRDFRRHDERIAGLPGLNARIMKGKRGEVKEECGEVGGAVRAAQARWPGGRCKNKGLLFATKLKTACIRQHPETL